jgi:hypothetical protein
MQQDPDFITADFLYMFRASNAHHREYKILTRQPPVQVVMVAGGSALRHMACQYFILLMMGAWRPKHVEKVCSNKIWILLHHIGVLFNLSAVNIVCIFLLYDWSVWAGITSGYSDFLGAGRSGDRIPVGARFSSPTQPPIQWVPGHSRG